jgi:Fe-S cluster assembly protein SufD
VCSSDLSLGFPTLRNEEWRYTNLQPLAGTAFIPAPDATGHVAAEPRMAFPFVTTNEAACVFVNGHFSELLSATQTIPGGVVITSISDALRHHPDLVLGHLSSLEDGTRDAFAELNTAFLQDGAFIYIPKNTILSQAIHVIFQSIPDSEPFVAHPRVLIVAEQGSHAVVVTTFAGNNGGVYFNNAVTEVVVGENATLEHYRLQVESRGATHIGNLHVRQERSSVFHDHAFLFGSSLTRNNISVVLDGEGAETTLAGISLVRGTQHMDTHTVIDHAKPHCSSREEYKGVVDDSGRSVFSGKIIVRKDAQKTDARQSNNNLLLSENASIDTKPQLEILADDVKCTHGATVGRLDESAVFYLRSRGIGLEEARQLLTWAFADDIVSRVAPTSLREYLDEYTRSVLRAS